MISLALNTRPICIQFFNPLQIYVLVSFKMFILLPILRIEGLFLVMTSFLFSFFSLSYLVFLLVLEVLNLNGCVVYWWRRKKHFIIAAFVAHFLIFLSVLNKTVQLGKELSSLQSELGRILFLLKIVDPSGEADQKRDSQVKDKKPDKAEVSVSATKKQPPTQGTKEK